MTDAPHTPVCFVIMPFGRKPRREGLEVDFDKVYEQLLEPGRRRCQHDDNPVLQLLMVATLDGFGLRCPLDEDRLLLCSVGTGRFAEKPVGDYTKMGNLGWAQVLLMQMIRDAQELNETTWS